MPDSKKAASASNPKGAASLVIGLSDWALEVLKEHRADQDRDREMLGADYEDRNLIFCQPSGAFYSPDRLGARVKQLMVKSGLLGVSLHSLRHSFASIALSGGTPLAIVSERLGHADQNITLKIYSHVLPTDKRAASKVWSNALSDVITASREHEIPRMLAHVGPRKPTKLEVVEKLGKKLAGTTGLEPATSDVTGRRSNQLSYVPACVSGQ